MSRTAYIRTLMVWLASVAFLPGVLVASSDLVAAEANNQVVCTSDDAPGDRRLAACTAIIESGKVNPKELAAAYRERAYALQGKQEFERALADATQSVQLDPSSAKAFLRRGDVYKNLDQDDLALQDFNMAIQLDPKTPLYFIDRSNIYLDKHDYGSAIADLDEALRLDPSDADEALVNRCNVLAFKGELDAALTDCQKAQQQHPNDPYAIGDIGFVYYKMGKYDQAIASYNAALGSSDLEGYDKAHMLYGRGLAKLKEGDKSGEADISEAKSLAKTVYHDFE